MVTKKPKTKTVKIENEIYDKLKKEDLKKLGFKNMAAFISKVAKDKFDELEEERQLDLIKTYPDLVSEVKKLHEKIDGIGSILKRAKYWAVPDEDDPHTEIHMHPLDDIELDKLLGNRE